jgi:hypothetical protein
MLCSVFAVTYLRSPDHVELFLALYLLLETHLDCLVCEDLHGVKNIPVMQRREGRERERRRKRVNGGS